MSFIRYCCLWSFYLLIGIVHWKTFAQEGAVGLIMEAEGNQAYCPNSILPIVTEFSISDPDTNESPAIYIQIVSGYNIVEDQLQLLGMETLFESSWNPSEAKLSIQSKTGMPVPYSDIVSAVKNVVYTSSNPEPATDKTIAITLGSANYLPSTGHYYEYVFAPNITWKQARERAKLKTYYGLKGYLATVGQEDEAQLIGELSPGVGWIGGSDEQTEGVWKWMDGPEAGTVFWNGLADGSTPNFAYWNESEPNNAGNEDYAHITDISIGNLGAWNDLPNVTATSGPFQAKGFLVEYGGMPGDPIVRNSASTQIFIPRIQGIENATGCEGQALTLTVDASINQLNWYDAPVGGNLIHTGDNYSNTFFEDQTFWLDWDGIGCSLPNRVKIKAKIYPYPVLLEPNLVVEQCDNDNLNDGITRFNLDALAALISQNYTQETFEFYTESDYRLSSKIVNPNTFRNTAFQQQLFVRINTPGNCYEESQVTLKVAASDVSLNSLFEFQTCETAIKDWGSGIEGWDVSLFDTLETEIRLANPKFNSQNIEISFYSSEEDAQLRQNAIVFSAENTLYFMETPYEQTLWARIENLDLNQISCLGVAPVAQLQVNPLPSFERLEDFTVVCQNLDPVPISVISSDDRVYTYQWFYEGTPFPSAVNSQTAVQETNQGGLYEVIATTTDGTNCSRTLSFTLFPSNQASITQEDLTVVDLQGETGSLEIRTDYLGIGDYEFTLYDPDASYQDDPYFDKIPPGIHSLFVRDKNGCGIREISFSVLGHMKFFSPNGDGINDRWKILGVSADFQPQSQIYIFDRYGRLITEISPSEEGWDGALNNSILPQDDYWFRVFFQDGRQYSGHFSLLRSR